MPIRFICGFMRNTNTDKKVSERKAVYLSKVRARPSRVVLLLLDQNKNQLTIQNLSHDSCLLFRIAEFSNSPVVALLATSLRVSLLRMQVSRFCLHDDLTNMSVSRSDTDIKRISLTLNWCWLTLWTADWLRLKSAPVQVTYKIKFTTTVNVVLFNSACNLDSKLQFLYSVIIRKVV